MVNGLEYHPKFRFYSRKLQAIPFSVYTEAGVVTGH